MDLHGAMMALGEAARAATAELARASSETKNAALREIAADLRRESGAILRANALDMSEARAKKLSGAMLDRLELNEARVRAMAEGVETIAALPDPIGEIIAHNERPNGLVIERVRVPLGVIGIIYESRPNVTADAGALCLKSGNAAILRGARRARARVLRSMPHSSGACAHTGCRRRQSRWSRHRIERRSASCCGT